MFRTLVAVCLSVLCVMVGAYAWRRTPPRAEFVYVNSTGINTLDPAQMSWTADIRVAINIWEGLTAFEPRTTRPAEGVARFPPAVSADGLVYTFTLQPDARWSNGDPVTAPDFIRGWRRAIEPGTAGDYARLITDQVAGAQAYYDWRNRQVAILTALKRLAAGWSVQADTMDLLLRSGVITADGLPAATTDRHLTDMSEPGPTDTRPPSGAASVSERRSRGTALTLAAPDRADWAALHRRHLRRHATEMGARFASVGLAAPDPRTLRVTLCRPCPFFLDLCAFPTLLPCHSSIERLRQQVADTGLTAEGLVVYDPQWTKPDYRAHGYPGLVTNGPYRLAEWLFKRRIRLEANPFHRARQTVRCPTIDMAVYGDLNTALMAYERGDVDFLPDMSVDYDHRLADLAATGQRPDFVVPVVFATYYYIFNCRSPAVRGRPNPFRDPRVRRAFARAIDKRLLTEEVLDRGDPISDHLVPPGSIPGYESPPAVTYDPAEARRLLADAGYPGGQGLPVIDLLYNTGAHHGRICEVLANMWSTELGAVVELRGKEAKTFGEDKVHHRYMIARAGWYGDYRDPTTFLDVFATGNGNNDAGFSAPEYDELLRRAANETDASRRLGLLAEAERILVLEQLPALPLHQHTNLMAISPRIGGLYPNPRLIFPFRYVFVKD